MNAELFSLMQEYLDKIRDTNVPVETMGGTLNFNPFFGLIHISMLRNSRLDVVNGSTFYQKVPKTHDVEGRVEIRVGDYDKGSSAHSKFLVPYVFKAGASELLMKRAINETVWDAIDNYIARLDVGLGTNNADSSFLDFSREEPVKYLHTEHCQKIDFKKMQGIIEDATAAIKSKDTLSCAANLDLKECQRYIANTEGSLIYTKNRRWSLVMTVRALDSENRIIEKFCPFEGETNSDMPSLEELVEAGRRLNEEVKEIAAAKIEMNGTYPTILDHINHGIIWHEVVGHSLEGHRQQDGEWGDMANLFTDRMGELAAPEFISLYDDPTNTSLNGHYLFDDEGIPGQRVALIENGVVKNFLHSRESAGYLGTRSNGHARAEDSEVPVSRMSNLIVESSKQVSYDELKDRLIRECKRQRKRYGLIMCEAEGGMTLPENSMFSTNPIDIFRLYTDGRTERVRGVYIVGTPAQALDNMLMTSDRFNVSGGCCGAESGYVTSSETAPDLLLKSVEVNRIPNSSYDTLRNPVLHE